MNRRSVVVKNVHFNATESILASHFSVCGRVVRVTIKRDKATGEKDDVGWQYGWDVMSVGQVWGESTAGL